MRKNTTILMLTGSQLSRLYSRYAVYSYLFALRSLPGDDLDAAFRNPEMFSKHADQFSVCRTVDRRRRDSYPQITLKLPSYSPKIALCEALGTTFTLNVSEPSFSVN